MASLETIVFTRNSGYAIINHAMRSNPKPDQGDIMDLTDDEKYWIAVAIEQSISDAKKLLNTDDPEEVADADLLLEKYAALQVKFPSPEIRLNEEDD